MLLMGELVREDRLDLVQRVRLQERVREHNPPGPARPRERRVRPRALHGGPEHVDPEDADPRPLSKGPEPGFELGVVQATRLVEQPEEEDRGDDGPREEDAQPERPRDEPPHLGDLPEEEVQGLDRHERERVPEGEALHVVERPPPPSQAGEPVPLLKAVAVRGEREGGEPEGDVHDREVREHGPPRPVAYRAP